MARIKGGYYIKARCVQESDIATAPPHVREIWDWLLKEANHSDTKVCKRGQCVRSYKDIQEGLKWHIGYRKQTYSKWQCEKAMKVLKRATMVTTTKTTRGMLITIVNYDKYQDPKNYESHNETHTRATMEPQPTDTINKNEKNVRTKKKELKQSAAKKPQGEIVKQEFKILDKIESMTQRTEQGEILDVPMWIIAAYWTLTKQVEMITSKEIYQAEIKRSVRAANRIAKLPYTEQNIRDSMKHCHSTFPDWTVETVEKYMTRAKGAKQSNSIKVI